MEYTIKYNTQILNFQQDANSQFAKINLYPHSFLILITLVNKFLY